MHADIVLDRHRFHPHPAGCLPTRPASRTRILHDQCEASRLVNRQRGLSRLGLIRQTFAAAAQEDLEPLGEARSLLAAKGSLLECPTIAEVTRRLTSSSWVVAEAWRADAEMLVGADCQIRLPEDRTDAGPVVYLPGEGDDCDAPDIVAAIRRRPASAAWIASVCADDAVAGQGYASAARQAAFDRIRALNPSRSIPVRYALGELFRLRGARLPDGRWVLLERLGQPELGNEASLRSNRRDSFPGGRLRNQVMAAGEWQFLIDWQVLIHPLEVQVGERHDGVPCPWRPDAS